MSEDSDEQAVGVARIQKTGNRIVDLDVYVFNMSKKPDNLQGTLDLLILRTLASREPMYGYGIAPHIEQVSDAVLRVEEGPLYPVLHRIEQTEWIRSAWKATENNRRARYYSITPAGGKRLADQEKTWYDTGGHRQ